MDSGQATIVAGVHPQVLLPHHRCHCARSIRRDAAGVCACVCMSEVPATSCSHKVLLYHRHCRRCWHAVRMRRRRLLGCGCFNMTAVTRPLLYLATAWCTRASSYWVVTTTLAGTTASEPLLLYALSRTRHFVHMKGNGIQWPTAIVAPFYDAAVLLCRRRQNTSPAARKGRSRRRDTSVSSNSAAFALPSSGSLEHNCGSDCRAHTHTHTERLGEGGAMAQAAEAADSAVLPMYHLHQTESRLV